MSARIVATARLRNHLRFGRDDVPRCPVGRGLRDRVVEGDLVVVPPLALGQVGHRELPALRGVVVARLEPLALLVLRDRQEELHDGGAVLGEGALELVDLVEPLGPHTLGHEVVDPDDQDILVVRAVEDPDLALARDRLVHPPQVVVGQLVAARDLEAGDRAPLRVEGLHHLVDRPVLAGGIDALEDHEHRVLRLGPEPVLQLAEPHELLRGRLGRRGLVAPVGSGGVELLEVDAGAGSDAQRVSQVGAVAHLAAS